MLYPDGTIDTAKVPKYTISSAPAAAGKEFITVDNGNGDLIIAPRFKLTHMGKFKVTVNALAGKDDKSSFDLTVTKGPVNCSNIPKKLPALDIITVSQEQKFSTPLSLPRVAL